MRAQGAASRRAPVCPSEEGSDTRRLLPARKARGSGRGVARADKPGQRRSAERPRRKICPARPALSRVVPRCPTCDFFWDKAGHSIAECGFRRLRRAQPSRAKCEMRDSEGKGGGRQRTNRGLWAPSHPFPGACAAPGMRVESTAKDPGKETGEAAE